MRVIRLLAVVLLICFGCAAGACAEPVTFFLMCNEGLSNDSGDVDNTMMLISLNPETGGLKYMMFTWDTFINYEGYETPQLMSQPFRVGGAVETVRVFNQNFNQSIQNYLSINFLNLAALIDFYGGVTVDVTRAERNAINYMIASKERAVSSQVGSDVFSGVISEYYLQDYGMQTELSGMQAVAYGWLQYDSVVNCCQREVLVVSQLFNQVGLYVGEHTVLYTDADEVPPAATGKRAINLDRLSADDRDYLFSQIEPIFADSAHNLTRAQIDDIVLSLMRATYLYGSGSLLADVDYRIFPLESGGDYVNIAGIEGLEIDTDANARAITAFLYDEE